MEVCYANDILEMIDRRIMEFHKQGIQTKYIEPVEFQYMGLRVRIDPAPQAITPYP